MPAPVTDTDRPTSSANVRLVVTDEDHRPRYLLRAAELEAAILSAAATLGMTAEDMPGLQGLCVEGARTAERHHR